MEAAGALLGLACENRWEGEAAALLEAATGGRTNVAPWLDIRVIEGPAVPVLPSSGLLAEVARRIVDGEDRATIAAGFHATLCRLVGDITRLVTTGSKPLVALSGGCFVNRLLSAGLEAELGRSGIESLRPKNLPPGDGGLSYGQAVVAAVATARDVLPRQTEVG